MKSFKGFLLVLVVSASLSLTASQSQANDRFHLPGRPVQRAASLLAVSINPVKATVAGVVKAKPVRSTLKFLFF